MKKFSVHPLALSIVLATPAFAQDNNATQNSNTTTGDAPTVEEVLVTGFRQSIANALDNKRGSSNSMESIVAEDIGKMPDLNLAESIQRVPGVAITREGGEGRQITVRGLGPDFTRVTLNGMEVPASGGGIDSSGGVNRTRAVDFNMFASELFNRIDIHKSARGAVEEGGLASTIDLYTARPFDNPGLQVAGSVQATVDNLADETNPRLTALVSNTFFDDTFGVLLSVAKSERAVRQEGFGSVRYSSAALQNASFAGLNDTVVNGTVVRPDTNCTYDPDFEANNLDATAEEIAGNAARENPINCLFTPRLPRMDYFSNTVDRLGVTGSLQFRPNDAVEFGLDYAVSELKNDRVSYNYASQFRSNWASITPVSITVDPSGKYITAGTFDDVRIRSESRGQFSESKFEQTVLTGKFDVSDNIVLSVMYGLASSEHDEEQDRFNIDSLPGGTRVTFDFSKNSDIPTLDYGFDILDASNYTVGGGLTVRQDKVERNNDTFKIDLDMDFDIVTVKTGFIRNSREVASARFDYVAPDDSNWDYPVPSANDPVSNYPGLAVSFQSQIDGSVSDLVLGKGFADATDAPSGFPRNFMVMDFDKAIGYWGVGNFALNPTDGSTFVVEENTQGVYTEADYKTELANMSLAINAGLRFVETETHASGPSRVNGELVLIEDRNKYDDVLPSLNVVLGITEELQARFSANKNITRPGLSDLVPRITGITPLNGNIVMGNSSLDPMRANSIDLGLEWYFTDEALLALTYFTKDVEGFITEDIQSGTLDPAIAELVAQAPEYDPNSPSYSEDLLTSQNPYTSTWNLQQPFNTDDVTIQGYELIYQQPFTMLPGFLANFGLIANLTYVDGESKVTRDDAVTTSDVPGLSKNSSNFTLYYEEDNWGARLSMNSRDDYITSLNGSNGNAQEKNTGPTRVDMSAFYDINENFTVRLEAINLTEEDERNYTTGVDGDLNLVREINNTGREIILGISGKF